MIAKGHGTFEAIKKLRAEGKEVFPAPGGVEGVKPYPADLVPVIDASGWTDSQFRAFVIADNKLALNAGWDSELLKIELDTVLAADIDADTLGFAKDELLAIADEIPFDVNHAGGLPEVIDHDVRASRSLVVHFLTDADVKAFEKAVGQKITPKARSIWYPKQPRNDTSVKQYASTE